MFKTVVRFLMTIIGFVAGFELFKAVIPSVVEATGLTVPLPQDIWLQIMGGAIFGLILYFISPALIDYTGKLASWIDSKMKIIPTQDIILGGAGLLMALLISGLLSFSLSRIPWVGPYLSMAVTLLLAYLGVTFVLNRREDFAFLTSFLSRRPGTAQQSGKKAAPLSKILDTSVIIDGRIMDIGKTGFLEGEIIVPGFVLEELRHIADSPDLLKRNRGRRGLDILNKMQKEMEFDVRIINRDYEGLTEVDSKLLKLAKELEGLIVTNDYNLNKVSELQGVNVLNINELANAVKPVVLPGEEMNVHVIKDGKEAGQGVAYLDDGTMIVVEGGKRHIGETIDVLVTSVLQTAAGRMIFAKPKSSSAEKVVMK